MHVQWEEKGRKIFSLALALLVCACSGDESTVQSTSEPLGDIVREGVSEDALGLDGDASLKDEYSKNPKLKIKPRKMTISANTQKSPNIIFLMLDDLPVDFFNLSSQSFLPNIFELKNMGTSFNRFYTPIGQCGPSRATMWTGMYPSQSGVQTNDFNDAIVDPNIPTLPYALKMDAGYKTGFFGKCHLGTKAIISALKDVWKIDRGYYVDPAVNYYNTPVIYKWTDDNPNNRPQKVADKSNDGKPIFYLENMFKEVVELAKTSATSAKPFYAHIAPRAPHIMTLMDTNQNGKVEYHNRAPEPYNGTISNPFLSVERNKDNLIYKPITQLFSSSAVWYWTLLDSNGFRNPDPSQAQPASSVHEYIRRAYEQVAYVDKKLGELRQELKKLRIDESNTIFVLTSDNGAFMGDRKLIMKGPFVYDDLVRVPLIISGKGIKQNHQVNSLVSAVDLYPTLLEFAGINPTVLKAIAPLASRDSVAQLVQQNGTAGREKKSVFLEYESQRAAISPIRGVVFKLNDNYYKFAHYIGSQYFSKLPEKGVANLHRGGLTLHTYLNHDATKTNNGQFEVPFLPTSDFSYEMYNLSSDPDELSNLLRFTPGINILEGVLKGYHNPNNLDPEIVRASLRVKAEFQSKTRDHRRIEISNENLQNNRFVVWNSSTLDLKTCEVNVETIKLNGTTVRSVKNNFNWNSRSMSEPNCYGSKNVPQKEVKGINNPASQLDPLGFEQPVPKKTIATKTYGEVVLRKVGCSSCPIISYRSYDYVTNHKIDLGVFNLRDSYEGVLYSINAAGQGGALRFTIHNGTLSRARSNAQLDDWSTGLSSLIEPFVPQSTQMVGGTPLAWQNRKNCSVFNGRGEIAQEEAELTLQECKDICHSNANKARVNRFCIHGKELIQQPRVDSSKSLGGVCRVVKQSGEIVKEELYTSFSECKSMCTQGSPDRPNHCTFGPFRFQHAGVPAEHYLDNLN